MCITKKGQFVAIPAIDRFWKYVNKDESSGCWLWTGNSVGRGNDPKYGQFNVESKPIYAHRYSYQEFKGPIPEGMHIHHICKNRLCVNPDHLELASRYDHPDGAPAMRRSMTHCKYGHEYSTENTYIRTTGTRRCRACDKIRYFEKVKPKRMALKAEASSKVLNHSYSEDNST